MADDEGFLYGSQAVPLSLPTNIGFAPGPDGDALMVEAMDWTTRQVDQAESCHRHFDAADILPTLPVDVNLDMLCNNDLVEGDVSAFTASLGGSDTAVIAADLYPSDVPLLTQKPFADDVPMREAPNSHSQMHLNPIATSDFSNRSFTLPARNQYPTTQDWEFYRPIFTRLYRHENRALEDVKSIMKATYGFHATDKMYKTRIREWQLFKNQKAAEKEQIVQHLEAQKKLCIDLGQPLVRGQEIKEHKIARHLREKRKATCLASEPSPRDHESRDTQRTGVSAIVESVCRGKRAKVQRTTFSQAVSFSCIKDPIEYQNTEKLLLNIDYYFSSKLEKNPPLAWDLWVERALPPPGGMKIYYTYQGCAYTCTSEGFHDVYTRFISAKNRFDSGRIGSGWKLIYESAEMIRPCLSQEDPNFCTNLFKFLAGELTGDYAEIAGLLLDLTAGMASVVYGERHPISQVCHALHALWKRNQAFHLAQIMLKDTCSRLLGNDHAGSLYIHLALFERLSAQESLAERKRSCREFIARCELIRGPSAGLTRYGLYELAGLHHTAGELSQAMNVISELLERGKDYGERDPVNISAREQLGYILIVQRDYDAAEDCLWIALSNRLVVHGPQDARTMDLRYFYKVEFDKQQASHEKSRGRTQSPETSCDSLDKPLRYPLRRRAKSLGSKSRLDP